MDDGRTISTHPMDVQSGNTDMWSRGRSSDHLVNLDEKWALTGITEISSPSPSWPPAVSSQCVCVSLSLSLFRYNGCPITCTQSLVLLGDDATVPLSERSKRPSLGSWFLVFWLEDCTLLVSDAATRRSTWPQPSAMNRRLLSTPGPGHGAGRCSAPRAAAASLPTEMIVSFPRWRRKQEEEATHNPLRHFRV